MAVKEDIPPKCVGDVGKPARKQKAPSKLKSIKVWVTVWALFLITYIVIGNKTSFHSIAQLLCAVPLTYIGANVAQKAIFRKYDSEEKT